MITNVKFLDDSFQLAVWCFSTLKQHGIHEFKGIGELLEKRHRYLQLHLESSVDDSEILLEKVGEDKKTHKTYIPICIQIVFKCNIHLLFGRIRVK